MKRLLFVLSIACAPYFSDEIITIQDASGSSEHELKAKAREADNMEQNALIRKSVATQPAIWEHLAPTPEHYDWIELTSGEWLKGSLQVLYKNTLEFESNKLGLRSFDFDDIRQLRTYRPMTVNIQSPEDQHRGFFDLTGTTIEATGIIRLKEGVLRLIQGDTTLTFPKTLIVSIASDGSSETRYWSGKLSLSYDVRKGNSEQLDYSATATLRRRTSKTRLRFDYIGNISQTQAVETANNHRINETLNLFVTRNFFLSPLTSEYYHDPYQNIKWQLTVGAGLGYTLIESKWVEWYVSGGPAYVNTHYETVETNEDVLQKSWAARIDSLTEIAISNDIDLTLDYHFTFLDEASGSYRHHMISTLSSALTSWLDLNLAFTWDYVKTPLANAEGIAPKQDDYRFLVGFGAAF